MTHVLQQAHPIAHDISVFTNEAPLAPFLPNTNITAGPQRGGSVSSGSLALRNRVCNAARELDY